MEAAEGHRGDHVVMTSLPVSEFLVYLKQAGAIHIPCAINVYKVILVDN